MAARKSRKKAVKKKAVKRIPATKKKAKAKRGRGQPPFDPTEEQRGKVEMMVGCGLTYKQIAMLTTNPKTGKGISTHTLERHFVEELLVGRAKVHAKVVGSLVSLACSKRPGAVTAQIWYTKSQLGWRGEERFIHEIDIASTGVLVAPAGRTPEEWIKEQSAKNKKRKPPKRRTDEESEAVD